MISREDASTNFIVFSLTIVPPMWPSIYIYEALLNSVWKNIQRWTLNTMYLWICWDHKVTNIELILEWNGPLKLKSGLGLFVIKATFNNILVISWRSVFIGGGNRSTCRNPPTCQKSLTNRSTCRKPPTCQKSLTNFITLYCIEYTSPERESNSTLVVIGSDCIRSCKSNYHTITT